MFLYKKLYFTSFSSTFYFIIMLVLLLWFFYTILFAFYISWGILWTSSDDDMFCVKSDNLDSMLPLKWDYSAGTDKNGLYENFNWGCPMVLDLKWFYGWVNFDSTKFPFLFILKCSWDVLFYVLGLTFSRLLCIFYDGWWFLLLVLYLLL